MWGVVYYRTSLGRVPAEEFSWAVVLPPGPAPRGTESRWPRCRGAGQGGHGDDADTGRPSAANRRRPTNHAASTALRRVSRNGHRRYLRCARVDSNHHGEISPQGPQPCASTNSATSAEGPSIAAQRRRQTARATAAGPVDTERETCGHESARPLETGRERGRRGPRDAFDCGVASPATGARLIRSAPDGRLRTHVR